MALNEADGDPAAAGFPRPNAIDRKMKLLSVLKRGQSRIYMMASTVLRMVAGLVVFIVLARTLGPATYGLFAATFAYASLGSLITDFGFATQIAQRIGARPDRAGFFLSEAMWGKSYLVVIGILCAVPVLAAIDFGPRDTLAMGLVIAAVVLNAYADMLLSGLRSAGHYGAEAAELAASTVVLLVLLAVCLLFHTDLLWATVAFAAAKALHVGGTFLTLRLAGITVHGSDRNPRAVVGSLRTGLPYAMDSVLTVLLSQIDVIMVSHLFGLEATGIYQIGSRLMMGAIALAVALTGVHLPKASSVRAGTAEAYRSYENRMMIEFIGLGVVLALALLVAGPVLVWGFLGPSYAAANALWAGFATFLLLRYVAAAFGICLLLRGRLGFRISAQVLSLVVTVGLILLAGRFNSLPGVTWAISGGTAMLVAVYAFVFLQARRKVA